MKNDDDLCQTCQHLEIDHDHIEDFCKVMDCLCRIFVEPFVVMPTEDKEHGAKGNGW